MKHLWKITQQEEHCTICGTNKGIAWSKTMTQMPPESGTIEKLIDKYSPCLTADEAVVKDVIE